MLAAVALGGWIMDQAANAAKTAVAAGASTPAAPVTPSPALGPLTPEQLAALQFNLPKAAAPAPAAPLRPAAAPKPVAAPAPAPAAKTGTS